MDYIIAWKIPTFPNFQGTSTNDIGILVNWLVVLQEPIPRGEGSWWIEGAGKGWRGRRVIACSYFAQYFGLDPHAPSSYFAQTMIWSGLWIHMQYRHFCRVDNLCVSKEEANNYYYKISFVSSNFLRFAGLWDKEYTKCAKGRDCHLFHCSCDFSRSWRIWVNLSFWCNRRWICCAEAEDKWLHIFSIAPICSKLPL